MAKSKKLKPVKVSRSTRHLSAKERLRKLIGRAGRPQGITGGPEGGEVRNPPRLNIQAGEGIIVGKYTGREIQQEGKSYLIMREDEVLAVLDVDPRKLGGAPGVRRLSAEEAVESASSSVDERRAAMSHDRRLSEEWEGYREALMVPRGDDSWKEEPASSMPAVPAKSHLVGSRLEDLESRYGVKIKVIQGNPVVLEPHASILVHGTGLSVREFKQAVETTVSR